MEKFETVDEVLDFAIAREQEAFDLYHSLASQAEDEKMRDLFTSFAQVEAGHKIKLQGIQEGTAYLTIREKTADLKIVDYLVEVEPSADMSLQDALVLAMQREQAAHDLYNQLALLVDDPVVSELLRQLAKEEAVHKTRFEDLYEERFLSEN